MASLEDAQGARQLQVSRQQKWLKRKTTASGQPEWRQRKRHRKAALQWIISLHNQMLTWDSKGLHRFIVDAQYMDDTPPEQWSRLAVAADMGSDGV